MSPPWLCVQEGWEAVSPTWAELDEVTAHSWGSQITADLIACSDLLLLSIFFRCFASSGVSLNLHSLPPLSYVVIWEGFELSAY